MSNFTKPSQTHQAKAVNSHKWMPLFALSVFALTLFGVKLWLISTYGNAIPLYDQWSGEAEVLYKPFLEGTLGWSKWFAPHNEHRIFTTRLLAVALLVINGVWSPLLQMVVNAALHVATLGLTIALLARVVGREYLPMLLIFSLVLFGVPYAFENILIGFQSGFYFLLLFSIPSLWLIITKPPLSLQWWGGVVCAIIAFFSLGSGAFAFAAALATYFIFYIMGLRRNREQLIAILILACLFIICVRFTPVVPAHLPFKAQSLLQLYNALISILGWPISTNLFSALILNLPALVFIGIMFLQRPPVNDYKWFLLTLIVWTFGQAVSVAYGRANLEILASRYLDLFAMGILVNFVCLILIAKAYVAKWRPHTIIAVSAWTFMVLIYLCVNVGSRLPSILAEHRYRSVAFELNTRHYLATNDITYLQKPYLIPFPYIEEFVLILSSPTIRSILPFNLTSVLTPPVATGRLDKVTNALLAFFHTELDSIVDFPEEYKEVKLTPCEFNQSTDEINESLFIVNQWKPLMVTGQLKVKGWLAFSVKDGIAADETFVTLTNTQGIVKYIKTYHIVRSDVKAYFKQPALPDDVGFIGITDVTKLQGDYKLGLAKSHAGKLERCSDINIPITINQTTDHESQ
jgi:hypothetical protein